MAIEVVYLHFDHPLVSWHFHGHGMGALYRAITHTDSSFDSQVESLELVVHQFKC
jgi:hypothetical protein